MAQTIPYPWILKYLLEVAEEYGADLSIVPRKDKGAKSQLVKFLTFPPTESNEPCTLWAEISDKQHIVAARLSAEAVREYYANPQHAGKSITSHKTALVFLKRYRVSFGRIPRGGSAGMTPESTLFLDVDEILFKGSFGEPMWGSPVDVARDASMREWIRGLRQDGGAGNVLKLRKQQKAATMLAEQDEAAKRPRITAAESHIQTTIDAMNVKVRVARKSDVHKPRSSNTATNGAKNGAQPRASVDKEALRRASWKRFRNNMVMYLRAPPDDMLDHLFSLCDGSTSRSDADRSLTRRPLRRKSADLHSHSPNKSPTPKRRTPSKDTPQSSPQRSPSHWSPSVRGSPRNSAGSSETEEEPDDDDNDAISAYAMRHTSSTKLGTESPRVKNKSDNMVDPHSPVPSIPPPPPAQQPPLSSVPYATSSPRASISATQQHLTIYDNDALPPSSLPAPVSSIRNLPSPTSSSPPSVPEFRRVPPPHFPPLRRDPDASGEGRVLVENSDTASPASQRIALSQSQSQSQSRESYGPTQGEPSQERSLQSQQSQSQSQRPSRLRNELGQTADDDPEGQFRGDPDAQKEDGIGADGDGPDGAEEHSQESAKSRQSLSYKGDSQSQDKFVGDPTPSATQDEPDAAPTDALPDQRDGEDADASMDQAKDVPGPPLQESAPEAVPGNPETTDAPGVPAPTWTAIRTVSSDEDSQMEEADVDELLSDPVGLQQEDETSSKKPGPSRRSRKRNGPAARAAGPERLDTDDERTAEMVNQYASKAQMQPQTSELAERRDRPVPRATSPMKRSRPRLSTPPNDPHPEPQRRPRKRRKQDANAGQRGPTLPSEANVFTSEDSFHSEGPHESSSSKLSRRQSREDVPTIIVREPSDAQSRTSVAPPEALAHDPTVWAAPTFMRKQTESRQTSKSAPGPSKLSVGGPKRSLNAISSPEEERPVKKQKISAAPPMTSTKVSTLKTKSTGVVSVVSTATVPLQPTSSQHAPLQPVTTPVLEASAASSTTGNTRDVQYIDLRTKSRSTSRSSSRASRPGSHAARQAQAPRSTPIEEPPTRAKGKAPAKPNIPAQQSSVPSRPHPVLPVLAGAKSVPSLQRDSGAAKQTKSAQPSAGISGSGRYQQGSAVHPSATTQGSDASSARHELVERFRGEMQHTRTPGGPPLLGWAELLEVLLETGQVRTGIQNSNEVGGHAKL
ncbi:hypothetical protein C8Q76DRAFT_688892 [Earliella scabrosa]|nr:hypothetical protein C8Q76DRAFT_688892 [Earliella scabrosa]